jgi:ATP phosphoribosyltransferase regulatory subunit
MGDGRAIRLPTGVRDFLPRAAARRRAIAERLLAEFELWGFEQIITPMFECADVLERGLGEVARASALRFVEPMTGEVVALRPDITPQIARIAATRLANLGGPLRLCYEGAVTRLSGGGARGQREILQAGVELIGADGVAGDVEVLSVAAAALVATQLSVMRLDLGHVALARSALADVKDRDLRAELEGRLARKDRHGVARAAAGLPAALRELCCALPTLYGEPAEVLARSRALALSPDVAAALDAVEAVLVQSRDVVERELHSSITLDLGEVRGFDYYTGIRFAGYVAGVGDAVLRGGRYDELIARYGRPMTATGFAVDIEAVAQAQKSCHSEPPAPSRGVLIAATPVRQREASRIAAALRAAGVRAAVDHGTCGPGALPDYATAAGFAHLIELGASSALLAGADVARACAAAAAGDASALALAIRERRRDER